MSDNAVIDLLDEAKRFLTEKGWTQGAFARNSSGARTSYADKGACSFCLRGAMMAATTKTESDVRSEAEFRLYQALIQVLPKGTVDPYAQGGVDTVSYNDTPGRTREDILNLIDIAKRLEKGE